MNACVGTFLLIFFSTQGWAASLETKAMRARRVPPGMAMTAVYGELRNPGSKHLGVTKVQTDVAEKATFHETVSVDGLSRMKPIPSLTLAPGETLTFLPGAKHIMLEQLKPEWNASDRLTLTFTFDDGSQQNVAVSIQENP